MLQELLPALEVSDHQDYATYKISESEYKLPSYLQTFVNNLLKELREYQDPNIMPKLLPYIGLNDSGEVECDSRSLTLDNLNCLSSLHKIALSKNLPLVNSPLKNKVAQNFRRIITRANPI